MNDPKDVPENVTPGTQKQDDVSGKGAEGAPAHSPLHPGVSLSATPAAAEPVAPAAGQADDALVADPMERLTAIVAQTTGQADVAAPVQIPSPSERVSPPVIPPVLMPPPVAVPELEIVAEDRSVAPQVHAPAKAKKGFTLFGRKKADPQTLAPIIEEARLPDEARPVPVPVKQGFWSRRKNRQYSSTQPLQRTARDKRWSRRRRRVWLEELLGWIFVPVILVGIYYAILGILTLMGTTPEAVISGIKMILGHF